MSDLEEEWERTKRDLGIVPGAHNKAGPMFTKPPRKNTRARLQALYGKREHPLKKQKAAFSIQKRNAKQRGIEWRFTFEEWWAWWQIDNRWENRGMGSDKFVMARKGDTGPYSPENVYCATHAENIKDVDPEKLRRPLTPEVMAMFRRRGAERHNSLPIETPAGRFANATEAADHFGITRQGVRYRIKAGWEGWRYVLAETA